MRILLRSPEGISILLHEIQQFQCREGLQEISAAS